MLARVGRVGEQSDVAGAFEAAARTRTATRARGTSGNPTWRSTRTCAHSCATIITQLASSALDSEICNHLNLSPTNILTFSSTAEHLFAITSTHTFCLPSPETIFSIERISLLCIPHSHICPIASRNFYFSAQNTSQVFLLPKRSTLRYSCCIGTKFHMKFLLLLTLTIVFPKAL